MHGAFILGANDARDDVALVELQTLLSERNGPHRISRSLQNERRWIQRRFSMRAPLGETA